MTLESKTQKAKILVGHKKSQEKSKIESQNEAKSVLLMFTLAQSTSGQYSCDVKEP